MSTLINLLLINLFVVLVHEAGFFETLDDMVNEKFKFHHLPYIFLCGLCQTFWLSLLYVLIAGPVSILTITLCIVNALLTRITLPLYRLAENLIMKLIELINDALKLQ